MYQKQSTSSKENAWEEHKESIVFEVRVNQTIEYPSVQPLQINRNDEQSFKKIPLKARFVETHEFPLDGSVVYLLVKSTQVQGGVDKNSNHDIMQQIAVRLYVKALQHIDVRVALLSIGYATKR